MTVLKVKAYNIFSDDLEWVSYLTIFISVFRSFKNLAPL